MKRTAHTALLGFILVTLVLLAGFASLYFNTSTLLEETGKANRSLVLDRKTSAGTLSDHLLEQGIYEDPEDAEFVARWITSRMAAGGSIPNLGTLNKDRFRIPVDSASCAGDAFRRAVAASKQMLGITGEEISLYTRSHADSLTRVTVHVLKTRTAVDTLSPDKAFRAWSRIPYIGGRIADRLLAEKKRAAKNQEGVPGVPVRIKDHTTDKAGEVLGYIITDSLGIASACLPSEGHFSFLPIRESFEYGAPKGTRNGPLGKADVSYTFRQRTHTIRPFDAQTYRRIKEDVVLTVRSPKAFRQALVLYPLLFLAAWWLLLLFLVRYDRRRGTESDYAIPLTLMCITGIGLLAMFSIVHPLTDTLLGVPMTYGAISGIVVMALASCVDWGYFYAVGIRSGKKVVAFDFILQFLRWLSRPFMEKISAFKLKEGAGAKQITGYYIKLVLSVLLIPLELPCRAIGYLAKGVDTAGKKAALALCKNPGERLKHWTRQPFNFKAPKGFGYLILVLLLVFLLQLFGDGPEGSGTKINLFFFQPSELNKYLVILFMAAYFAERAERITLFSEVADSLHLRLQLNTVLLIMLTLAVLLVLYMVVMSDMGPALVLIVTFIFLYSIARKDFRELLIGIATFLGMVWLGGIVSDGSLLVRFLFAAGWLAAWILFWYLKDKRLYESAIFFNFLLSAFLFLGNILAASTAGTLRDVGQRILDRNEVALHIWENSVRGGGDQVVQGIWGLASGGLLGQGLGKGNPNLVPAFHTDMILTSIGEEMGWVTVLVIIIGLAILIHRSLVIAYNSGNRFLFFLSSGIAIITGVQFFVIAFGSIGIIPLTGVAVPFLSFGMTSLIINLAAFGIILSVSRAEATENQREMNRPYRYVTAVGIWSFLALSFVLGAILFVDQVFPPTRNKYLIRPAYIANNDGYRIAEYNPRIRLLLKEMKAGNLLDRNGLLLATSNRDWYPAFVEKADSTLLSYLDGRERNLFKERNQLHARYYPFGQHTFFIVGDLNTQTLWGIDNENPYGFLAEERLLGELRGFSTILTDKDNLPIMDTLRAQAYHASPFAAPEDTLIAFRRRDYKSLLPYLRNGIHGRRVREYNEASIEGERDIRLTVDARLQTILQSRMASFLNDPGQCSYNTRARPKLRASAVILDARNGDVLTSSNYPLPDQKMIRDGQNRKEDYLRYEQTWDNPVFTDRDLGATFPTHPGSTAKIMSAMAGFMREGTAVASQTYDVRPEEQIHHSAMAMGTVSLKTAIVYSSNCYFINLVNDKDLYPELESIYSQVGASVETPSYSLFREELPGNTLRERREKMHRTITNIENTAVREYERYQDKRDRKKYERMAKGFWQLPWGQSPLEASPLTMARVVSVVCNNGILPETRWICEEQIQDGTRMLNPDEAAILKDYMLAESARRYGLPAGMGGKTGTPERERQFSNSRQIKKYNDAWYVCFVETQGGQALSIAVRLERVGVNSNGGSSSDDSGKALDFVRKVVVPSLIESGYIIE